MTTAHIATHLVRQSSQDTFTHWKKLTDPRFIGVYALPNQAEDLTVIISCVKYEELTMMHGKKEWHTVVYLVDQKPLILNKINAATIERLYSPYIENWPGKNITLFASTCDLGREKNIPCLRIRPSCLDISPLIAAVLKTQTDTEALQFWKDNNGKLAKDQTAHAKLKEVIAAHRFNLSEQLKRQIEPKVIPEKTDELKSIQED